MKMILIIPTKDRPIDIQNLFASLLTQTRKPDLIIVVDGSDNPIKAIIDTYTDRLNVHYFPCRPPSLPKQRNVGISNVPTDADWIGFLDDDLVLENNTLECLENFITKQQNPQLKGVGLSVINQPTLKKSLLNHLFLLSATSPGQITKAGYPTAIPCVSQDVKTDWIYGGATFWAADIFKEFTYDEWFHGTGYMEDIDFSYRVSRKYDLMISSLARCNHYDHEIPLTKEASRGEWQFTSWWYFVSKHNNFFIGAIIWAMFGVVLKNILSFFVQRSKRSVQRLIGNWRGIVKIFSGKALELKGFSK